NEIGRNALRGFLFRPERLLFCSNHQYHGAFSSSKVFVCRAQGAAERLRRMHMLFWIAATGAALGAYSCGMQDFGHSVFGASESEPFGRPQTAPDNLDPAEKPPEPASR